MTYLISVLAAALLLFGFLLITIIEGRRGTRFFAGFRYKFDLKIARAEYLIEHIDWGAFTAHLTKTSLQTVAHDAAHGTLIGVRALERGLTRTVRSLRHARSATNGLPPAGEGAAIPSALTNLAQSFRRPKTTRPMNDIVRRESGE